MTDVKRMHYSSCKNYSPCLDFSLDGIQESKSSGLSVDIYSVSFKGCRTVYPIRIIKAYNKFKVNEQENIKEVINDINCSKCKLMTCVCDNPKRSNLKCTKCHSAYFACEYCMAKAVLIQETNKNGRKIQKLVWPASTLDGEQRTLENVKEITDKIRDSNVPLSIDECKGFIGISHLLNQPNFHFITDIPAEYMHSSCLGTVKRTVELTFNVGESRERITNRKLSEASSYNEIINDTEEPREFSKRCRNLDIGILKAQDYRNISLFFYPIVVQCIPENFKQERKLWLCLGYVLRACIIDNDEFALIPIEKIKKTALTLYKLFESVYGPKNCTYSIHVVIGHILDIRGENPLHHRSAFKFENFYSELRTLFEPGTTSTTKQMLENCYVKRQLEDHSCRRNIFYDVEKKGKECNNLIYLINEEMEHEIYSIVKINDNDTFLCTKQGRFEFVCDLTKIEWKTVGVYKVGPFSDEQQLIHRKDIRGKVLKVCGYYLTCPNDVLREQ